jgi:hypothetical protein
MTPNRGALGWRAVVALALTALPLAVRAQGPLPGNEADKSLDAIAQELDRLRKDTSGSFQAAQKGIEALREEVARLRKEVEELRRPQTPAPHEARFTPAASGSILLMSTYPQPVSVIVNGTIYRLAPGETRWLRDQPAGTFTYELVGAQPPVERVLAANATYWIHVHPR